YRHGIHIYELGTLAHARNTIRHAALPTLRQVASVTGLTVNLAVPDGPDIVFMERIENRDGVRILGHFGRRLPAHTTSSGKVIAAFNSTVDQSRRAVGFPPRAGQTIRTESDWAAGLGAIRTDGYAVARSESFDGASSIAVPILERGVAVAAISVFGPSEIIDPKLDALVPVLRAAATRIARTHSGAAV
ncbi:MAG: IclR family transcriptional regulator, partial [Intrasporangiaceae bacterium]|nr:IclR family transcriptional regulator [Intrasporangiaceae bacterium]